MWVLVDVTWLECRAEITSESVLLEGVGGQAECDLGEFDCLRIEREIPATVFGVTFGGSLRVFLISEKLGGMRVQVREKVAFGRSLSVQLRRAGWKIFLPPESMSPQVQELRPASVYKPYSF